MRLNTEFDFSEYKARMDKMFSSTQNTRYHKASPGAIVRLDEKETPKEVQGLCVDGLSAYIAIAIISLNKKRISLIHADLAAKEEAVINECRWVGLKGNIHIFKGFACQSTSSLQESLIEKIVASTLDFEVKASYKPKEAIAISREGVIQQPKSSRLGQAAPRIGYRQTVNRINFFVLQRIGQPNVLDLQYDGRDWTPCSELTDLAKLCMATEYSDDPSLNEAIQAYHHYQQETQQKSKDNEAVCLLRDKAKSLGLSFVADSSIERNEPVIPIVNLRERRLLVKSRADFSKEQKITWSDDVIHAPLPSPKEQAALDKAARCQKALLETDYGYGVVNLDPITAGEYVCTYEGEFSKIPFYFDPNDSYILQYSDTSLVPEGVISAKKFRGFGGYLQHLPNEEGINDYQLSAQLKSTLACENIRRVHVDNRVFYKAKTDMTSLTLLGFSYHDYWCRESFDPVLFNARTGYSIPKNLYTIRNCHILFVFNQFLGNALQTLPIERLAHILKTTTINTVADYLFRAEHLAPLYEITREGALRIKRVYARIFIDNLAASDFISAANGYWVSGSISDLTSPEHLNSVIKLYQKAEKLLVEEKNQEMQAECQSQIVSLNKILHDVENDSQEIGEAEIIAKYKKRSEEKLPSSDLSFRRAAAQGNLLDMQRLLALGANINSCGEDSGKSAMHWAVIINNLAIISYLLLLQASCEIRDKNKKTPMDYTGFRSNAYLLLNSKKTGLLQSLQQLEQWSIPRGCP